MVQLTLVARYGNERSELSDLVGSCQQLATTALGMAFRPYDPGQLHATIIGLERHKSSGRENANFRRFRRQRAEMDIAGFLESLRMSVELPLEARIGGFGESERPFLSRNALPYKRSFSIQGDKAVVMGWPYKMDTGEGSARWPQTLDAIRRSAQTYGILHTYHRSDTDRDNDLFFRIGLIDRSAVRDEAVEDLEQRVRRHMSRRPPLIWKIGVDELFVAIYRDEKLPLSTTEIWPLSATGLKEKLAVLTA